MTRTMIRHFNKFFSRVCIKDDVKKAKKAFKYQVKNSYLFVNKKFDEQTILTLAIENRHNELAIDNALIILEVLKEKNISFIKTEQEVHQEILDTMTSFFYDFNDSIKKNEVYRELFAFSVQREKFEYREEMHEEIIDFMISLRELMQKIKETGKLLPEILATTQETLKATKETLSFTMKIDKKTTEIHTDIESLEDRFEDFYDKMDDYLKEHKNELEKIKGQIQEMPSKTYEIITENIIKGEKRDLHPPGLMKDPQAISEVISSMMKTLEKENIIDPIKLPDVKQEVESKLSKILQEGYPLVSEDIITDGENLRILLLGAEPKNYSKLYLDQEFEKIEDELRLSKYYNNIKLTKLFSTKPKDVSRLILKYNPTIVHFSAHATRKGEIVFEDDAQKSNPILISAMVPLFDMLKHTIRCVVLNTEFAREIGEELSKIIDYVIGFPETPSNEDAIEFATGFYRGIGVGLGVPEAFKVGVLQAELANSGFLNSPPVLYISK